MARHTLSCCIVVRNEEEKITACLDNIDILADEIIVVDTGSTDSTCNAVMWWINKKRAQKNVKLIPVGDRFHDKDGDFNFGKAKTFAFKNATKDFVMWLDASDIVFDQKRIKRTFLQETSKNPNVYFVLPTALSKRFSFTRARIGPRSTASMIGRIHEYMGFKNAKDLTRMVINVPIKNFKNTRDLDRNLRLLKKEWKREKTARTCFYIASTYRDMMDPKQALKWFRKRVYDFEFKYVFKAEYFKALESIAEIILEHNHAEFARIADIYDVAQEMIEREPDRYEGHFYMGKYYMEHEKWKSAIEELRKYKQCKKPEDVKLWVNGTIYSGKAILRSIEKCKTALKYDGVLEPDEIIDYKQSKSTYKIGNQQYLRSDTIK